MTSMPSFSLRLILSIVTPQNQSYYLTNVSWLLDMRKVAVKSRSPYIFLFAMAYIYILVCDGLSNNDVAVARGTAFPEVRPGTGFKTGQFR